LSRKRSYDVGKNITAARSGACMQARARSSSHGSTRAVHRYDDALPTSTVYAAVVAHQNGDERERVREEQ
jgi:hypothetical protein